MNQSLRKLPLAGNDPDRPSVLLLELNRPEGHQKDFAALYARMFQEAGWDVSVAMPGIRNATELSLSSSEAEDVSFFPLSRSWNGNEFSAPSRFPRFFWRLLTDLKELKSIVSRAEAARSRDFDLVFFLSLDRARTLFQVPLLNQLILRRVNRPLAGLFINDDQLLDSLTAPGIAASFRKLGLRQALSSYQFLKVGVLTTKSGDALKSMHIPSAPVPDTTPLDVPETDQVVEELKKRAQGRPIVLLAGYLNHRKGLATFVQLPRLSRDRKIFFCAVGRWDRTHFSDAEIEIVSNEIENPSENAWYLLQDEAIPSMRFNALIKASSVIYMAYVNFDGSSNVLTKAAHFGKPVVASRNSYLGKIVETSQIGFVADPSHANECFAEIEAILRRKPESFQLACRSFSETKDYNALKKAWSPLLAWRPTSPLRRP